MICGIVGVPLEDHEQFAPWAEQINTGPLDPEQGHGRVAGDARRTSSRWSTARRAEPTGDLLSELVHAEVDGERLTDEKIYGFLRLLLPGRRRDDVPGDGQRAATRCCTHPDDLARVVADPDALLPEVIEETLRWETSVTMVSRVATRRHRDRRLPDRGRLAGRTCSPDRPTATSRPLRRRRRVEARPPDAAPPRVRHRPAPVPRDAPRPARAARRARPRSSRRLPNLRLDPDGPTPRIQGYAFRGPDTPAGPLRPDELSRPGSTSCLR